MRKKGGDMARNQNTLVPSEYKIENLFLLSAHLTKTKNE